MLDLLNHYSAALQILLTAVYVLCTIGLVWVGTKQIAQVSRLEAERVRPYVVFDLEFRGFMVVAVLKNRGLTPALDVRLTVNPPLFHGGSGEREPLALSRHVIPFLAPGRELSDSID